MFAVTFVVAVHTLDEQRMGQNRSPIFPCIVRKERNREPECDPRIANRLLKSAYNVILSKPGKVMCGETKRLLERVSRCLVI